MYILYYAPRGIVNTFFKKLINNFKKSEEKVETNREMIAIAKTADTFHGGNPGSIPGSVTIEIKDFPCWHGGFFFVIRSTCLSCRVFSCSITMSAASSSSEECRMAWPDDHPFQHPLNSSCLRQKHLL